MHFFWEGFIADEILTFIDLPFIPLSFISVVNFSLISDFSYVRIHFCHPTFIRIACVLLNVVLANGGQTGSGTLTFTEKRVFDAVTVFSS